MGGVFDVLSNQKDAAAFSHIKKEIRKQEDWIIKLHSYSTDIHRYIEQVSVNNSKHKKEVLERLNSISEWVESFSKSHYSLKQEVHDLKKSLRKTLKEDFEAYH